MHCDGKTFALLPKKISFGDSAVCKDQLICGGTADTHLVFFCTKGKSGCSFFYDKCGNLFLDSAAFFHFARYGYDNVYVCFLTVGNKTFAAVQYPFVAVQDSLCLLSLCVSTCTGLCQAESAQLLAFCQRHYIFLFLLFCTIGHDRIDTQRGMCGNDNAGSTAHFGKLFHAHSIGQGIAALSAILLGNRNPQEAVFSHFLNRSSGEHFCFIHLLSQRLYFFFGELSE